jgi:hypothetical protein
MPQWNRFDLGIFAACAIAAAMALPCHLPGADDETVRALAAIKAVTREGRGNEDAAPAWKTLVGRGAAALFPTLEAFDESNPTAMNWLRTAVDAIAEAESAGGRSLPGDKLEAFVKDTRHAPAARRVAYELLIAQEGKAKDRLLPGFLNDKSPDLRRDAIARELDILERAARPTLRMELERLFRFARDKDQVDLLAKKIEEAGGKVSISEHFGFVTLAALIGPFDSPGGKGFATPYAPETATDATGSFKGKDGADLTWKSFDTTDKYGKYDLNNLLGKHKDAVAYAFAVIVAEKAEPCEIRATSSTSVKILLNGKELFGRDEYHHGSPFDGMIGRGTLKQGENTLVLKVCQNNQTQAWAQDWFFQVRVCDDTGGPLPLQQKIGGTKPTVTKLGFIADAAKTEEKK